MAPEAGVCVAGQQIYLPPIMTSPGIKVNFSFFAGTVPILQASHGLHPVGKV
jgi:hypothetical protein